MASDPVYALAGRNGLGRMANVQTSQPLVTCSVSPPRRGFFVGCEEYDGSANDPSTDSIIAARTREMLCVRSDTARPGFLCRSSRVVARQAIWRSGLAAGKRTFRNRAAVFRKKCGRRERIANSNWKWCALSVHRDARTHLHFPRDEVYGHQRSGPNCAFSCTISMPSARVRGDLRMRAVNRR